MNKDITLSLSWPLPEAYTDTALEKALYPSRDSEVAVSVPDIHYLKQELNTYKAPKVNRIKNP